VRKLSAKGSAAIPFTPQHRGGRKNSMEENQPEGRTGEGSRKITTTLLPILWNTYVTR